LELSFRFIIGEYLGELSALSEKISWCISLAQGRYLMKNRSLKISGECPLKARLEEQSISDLACINRPQ
jgi:hypothetical protein